MKLNLQVFLLTFLAALSAGAESSPAYLTLPSDPYFSRFHLLQAPPPPRHLLLRAGDRLAICGDSITEQRMYSRIMETYITVALPELDVKVRQYGWSGEWASGFLKRMTND